MLASIDFKAPGIIDDSLLYYAVMVSMYEGKLVLVRNEKRITWEMPGGRREPGESINQTAARELFEETGALEYSLNEICDYIVSGPFQQGTSYGRLFYSDIKILGPLPEMEIAEIKFMDSLPSDLTYPHIQPFLYKKAMDWIKERG